jgi:glycosyltransferase involved in cell wall biosynthesis
MRILVQALVAAPGGSLTVLRDLVAAWPHEDDLLVVCWRPESVEALAATGRNVVRVPARSTEEALLRLRLRRPAAVRAFAPDVVWSQAVHVGGFDVPQAVHYRDIGSFTDIHPRTFRQSVKRVREGRDLSRAGLRIFNSATLRDAVLARYSGAARMPNTVIPNGLDLSAFVASTDAHRTPSVRKSDRTVLLPQSDAPHKRNPLAIEVMDRMQALDPGAPPVTITVVGGGAYLDVRSTAKRLGLEHRVTFTGYVDRSRMAELYATHDAVLMTGLAESFGNPILEAHAVGRPVVLPPFAAAKEFSGPLSRIAARDDADSLAHALRTALVSDPDPSQVAAGKSFAATFSAERAAERLRSALRRLTEQARVGDALMAR